MAQIKRLEVNGSDLRKQLSEKTRPIDWIKELSSPPELPIQRRAQYKLFTRGISM